MHDLPFPVSYVCFEDYGPINRTSGKIAQRAEMCGVIKYHALTVMKVPVITITPKALKSFATGNGNSGKDKMLEAANKQGYFPDTHDEADAYFVSRVGLFLLRDTKTGVAFEQSNPVR